MSNYFNELLALLRGPVPIFRYRVPKTDLPGRDREITEDDDISRLYNVPSWLSRKGLDERIIPKPK